jgi:2-polyprenyl-6-methoxyphenol hydroxylase-like FAD-dependent oxidoreductase
MHAHDPLSPPPRPFTVIVLGSNLSSLALALSLTRKNIAFTLLARSLEDSFVTTDDGDSPVVLHPHGIAILSQLGVWDVLKPRHIVTASRRMVGRHRDLVCSPPPSVARSCI